MNNPLVIIMIALLGAILLGVAIVGACVVIVRLRSSREYIRRTRAQIDAASGTRRTPERVTFDHDRGVPRTPPGRAFDAQDRDAAREFWQAPPFTSRPKR